VLEVAILSAWVTMTLCMWFAATGSFGAVRRVLEHPSPQLSDTAKSLTADQARLVMRHTASEINRTYFRGFGWAQVVFGVLLLVLLAGQSPRDPTALAVAAAMVLIVLPLTFYVTPEIIALGRQIDFVPRDPAPPEYARFRTLHAAFTILDGMKLLAGLGLLVRWIWKS
jgi:hypothetical protein